MTKRIKAALVDIDHTLVKYDRDELFAILDPYNISNDLILGVWEKLKKEGRLEMDNFWKEVSEEAEISFDYTYIEKAFDKWLANPFIFKDAFPFLQKLQRQKIPIVLLTAGGEEMQRNKVEKAKLPNDFLEVAATLNGKIEITKKYLKSHGEPLMFVTDRVVELDRLREGGIGSEVKTVWLKREGGAYAHEKPAYEHQVIESLDELI